MLASDTKIISPKKLIEVAIPLDIINVATLREKSIRHGHPASLHLWWARRPLAAARAVIFSQLVHDPEDLWKHQNPGIEPNAQVKGHWKKARKRLFDLIENLVKWENTTNVTLLKQARDVIWESWRQTCELNRDHPQARILFNPDELPGLHDPFAGGGAIPLEAQRLGLKAFASDLNPVAVMINKAMIEIPPKFSGLEAVHPASLAPQDSRWAGASGLAEDVRCYGVWMRKEAERRIGNYYPKVQITEEMAKERPDLKLYVGKSLTVIAWIWARTVKSPNPAFSHVDVPLASSFVLSSKEGKEAWVEPIIDGDTYSFKVRIGKLPSKAKSGTTAGRRAGFLCLMSGLQVPLSYSYIRLEGQAGRMGQKLMAIVVEGQKGRLYLSPTAEQERLVTTTPLAWKPELKMSKNPRWFGPPQYGLETYAKLFNARQLLALTTFSDLVTEVREVIYKDALKAGRKDDGIGLAAGGNGALAYSEAVSVYLGLLVGQIANHCSSICGWNHPNNQLRSTFSRQALPMTWDYAEANTFSKSTGSYINLHSRICEALATISSSFIACRAEQRDVMHVDRNFKNYIVSTDPPYYDNIGYADLSDFFYVWLRRSLRSIYPDIFATIAVPKDEELIATPYRHQNSKLKAEEFFLNGMKRAMQGLSHQAHPAYPITIYYAFKQSETKESGTTSTGWETFLEAVLQAGLQVCGTWPIHSEKPGRSISIGTNALASSIVLVCRNRAKNAQTISRRQFIRQLNETLPFALAEMTRNDEGEHSPVAPVDLSQAIIGPGMGIFSQYEAVLEADGSEMSVKSALQLINRFLAEEDFDPITHFCLHWLEQMQFREGSFGEADVLARAKGTSVEAMKAEGVLTAQAGKVRLFTWQDTSPQLEGCTSAWYGLHAVILALKTAGDSGAAKVLAQFMDKTEVLRQLAYRLYTVLERKGFSEQSRVYNEVITGWDGIDKLATKQTGPVYDQAVLRPARKVDK